MSVEPEAAPADRNEHADTPGHPRARGTLPMARHLIDLAIEEEIQRHARTAPRMTVDQAIRIARLVGWNEPPTDREAGRRTDHAA